MKRNVVFEVKKLMREPSLHNISFLAITFVSISFIIDAIGYIGYDLSDIQSASNMWILVLGNVSIIKQRLFLDVYLLLAVPIIIGDSYLVENELNIIPIILSRTNRFARFFSKSIVAFLCSVIVVAIPLILDQLLWLTCFPIYGFEPLGRNEPTYNLLNNVMESFSSELFRLNYPYLYNLLFVIINTIFGWSLGLFSQIVSFLGVKSKIVIIMTPAIILNFLTICISQFGNEADNVITYLYYPTGFDSYKGVLYPFTFILPLIAFELLIIYYFSCRRRPENG